MYYPITETYILFDRCHKSCIILRINFSYLCWTLGSCGSEAQPPVSQHGQELVESKENLELWSLLPLLQLGLQAVRSHPRASNLRAGTPPTPTEPHPHGRHSF